MLLALCTGISPPSGLCSNITFSVKPSLSPKVPLPVPSPHPLHVIPSLPSRPSSCQRDGRGPRPGASGGSSSRWPEPLTPPEIEQTFLPVPRRVSSPSLPGFQLPGTRTAAAPCKEGSGGWGGGPGPAYRHAPPPLRPHSGPCSGIALGFSQHDSLSLSPSLSLSLPPRTALWPARLPSPSHSGASPREAESEGPRRSGCRDISLGGGLCRPGPWQGGPATPLGGRVTEAFLSCVADQCGARPGAPHLNLNCLLSLAVTPPPALRKPRSDPDLVTDLPGRGPCLLPATPGSFSAKWL